MRSFDSEGWRRCEKDKVSRGPVYCVDKYLISSFYSYDYNKGQIDQLIEVMIEKKVAIFVCAVGLPPKRIVERLHEAGILYMNMCGAPKHAVNAAKLGADLVCATGSEAGGHTGDIPTMILIPAVAEAIKGMESQFTKRQVGIVAGGGIYNGQTLAAALALGAGAVWVGTRFILSEESGSSTFHQDAVREADHGQVIRSTIFTGRPLHSLGTPYLRRWENERKKEMLDLQAKGIIPVHHDMDTKPDDDEVLEYGLPILMGKVAAMVKERLPARRIVEDMVEEASKAMSSNIPMLSKF